MKYLVLLGLVAAVSAFGSAELSASLHTLQALHAQVPNRVPAPQHLQTYNATACLDAWYQLENLLNGTCGAITAIYQVNLTGINVTDYVINQCVVTDSSGHTCQQKVTYAITKFSDYCSGPGTAMDNITRASLDMWLTIANIPCLQDTSGAYCFPVYRTHMDSFMAQIAMPGVVINDVLLDGICIPCVLSVVNTLATWGAKNFVTASIQLKIACTQRNNDYCWPYFLNVNASSLDLTQAASLDIVCNDCVRIIAYRLYVANLLLGTGGNLTVRQDLESYLALSEFACTKNSKGYCYPQIDAYEKSYAGGLVLACASTLSGVTACPANCKTDIQNFASNVGCCFGTWLNFLNFSYMYYPNEYGAKLSFTPNQIKSTVIGCGVSVPTGCATKKLVAVFNLANILEDWYTLKKAWLEAQFLRVVAYVIATNPDFIMDVTSSYDPQRQVIVITVNVGGFSDDDVTKYNEFLSTALTLNDANDLIVTVRDDYSSSGTAQTGAQTAALDQPITVSAQSTTIQCQSGQTCWGCAISPSFSLSFLLVLLLAYFN